VRTINLGMQRAGLLYLRQEGTLRERYEVVAQELLRSPGVASVTTSGQNPLQVKNNTLGVQWPGKTDEQRLFAIINTNYDFVRTMGMELAAGRDFTREFQSDRRTYLVNEEAAKLMGGDVVGMTINVYGWEGEIVGVVKNFSMNSLYSAIEPTIIRFHPEWAGWLFVRTNVGETREALASLKAVCEKMNPEYPFEYTFVDDEFEKTYRSESVLGQLANIFAVVAIFISCLGLFGLTAFIVDQRTKEVGIRKVLGASVASITTLLSGSFIKLVLVGALIAIPVASYVMKSWLDGFATHINMSWWIFALAVAVVLVIALCTVGFRSMQAAMTNPVKTLRSE
jgi:putative ABC transport system permease protein